MLSVLAVILPVFALIMAGWLARRTGVLGPRSTGEINRFVVHLALPALLFDIVANADWATLWQPAFVVTFGMGAAVIFIVALTLSKLRSRHLSDAAIDGLNASYANVGFMGIPLALVVFGQPAMIPALITTILTVCILFTVAIVVVEIGLQAEGHPGRMLLKISMQLGRNPLLVAPVLGAIVMMLGIRIPAPIESFLKLLGGAASPCALVGLGLFLAQNRARSSGVFKGQSVLVALKLLVHPFVTWIFATQIFHLPQPMTQSAVLLAALPTGTGPFMVAQYYRREGGVTSSTILVSTLLSLLTITGYLMLEHP